MKSIRSGSGLGDSIYLQAAVRHLVKKGEKIEVCTDWPDVFRPLNGHVTVSPFRRDSVDIKAHYAYRKHEKTDQFEDVCIRAGIHEPVDFKLDWQPINTALVSRIRGLGGPIVAVQLPRTPMGRSDGFGKELLPNCEVIDRAIAIIGKRARIIQIGSGDALFHFGGIDLDLSNRTSVTDLIDAAWACDGMLGYVSFAVPLAESLEKPALFVWSLRGKSSKHEFIRQITPQKILHRPTSRAVWDDCGEDNLRKAVDEFCKAIRHPPAL